MVKRYFYLLRFMLALSDLILINACLFLGYYLADKYYDSVDFAIYKDTVMISNLIWFICITFVQLYSTDKIQKIKYIYKTTGICLILHLLSFLIYLYATGYYDFPKHFFISFYLLASAGFVLSRFTGTAFQNNITQNADLRHSVGILGASQGGLKLAEHLKNQSTLSFKGFFGSDVALLTESGELNLASHAHQFRKAVRLGINELYVCFDPRSDINLATLTAEGEKYCVRLKFVPDFTDFEVNYNYNEGGNFMVLSSRDEPLESMHNRFQKRLFDIAVSLLVIVFILSWLLPILALIIKIQSRGPVIFKQERSGRDNAPFWCYKFRSMRMNDESGQKQASRNDSRITPIGKFMRKTSLDEFPQFFNVLSGDMSIIGPRPHMVAHTEQYRAIIDTYMVRQFLKPGISGWAQVNGYRGETKDPALMERRVEHDIWYMSNWSLLFDIKIMIFTVINVFKGEDKAY